MPNHLITYRKPNYLGTDLQLIGTIAAVKSRSRLNAEKALAGRLAVGDAIRGKRVRIVRINCTPFIMTANDHSLPDDVEHYRYAKVVAADAKDGSIVLSPEN